MTKTKLPERAINYIKLGTTLLCSWPLPQSATSTEKLVFEIQWWLLCLLAWSVELPMLYSVYLTRNDFMDLTKFICFSASIGHGIIKMIICRRYRKEFQKLIGEMEEYLDTATAHQREALDACVRKAAPIHLAFNMTGYLAAGSVALGPFVLDQAFPTEALYPFNVYDYPTFQLIFIMQVVVCIQCSAVGPLDGQVCILIWFTIARLKLLEEDMRTIQSMKDLNRCIRIHQDLLRYIDEVTIVAKPIVLTTVAMATIAIAFGGIHVVGNEPFNVKVQFVGLDIGYGLQLFLSAWAAENLLTAMENVKGSLYASPWLNSSKRLNKSVIFVMLRLNKLPTISMGGFIPELSLNYYARYLSKTASFFTTLHIMLQKMEATAELS